MNKRKIAIAVAAVVVVAASAWGIWRATRQKPEQTPEQTLVGDWAQTKEHLAYENEYVHSAADVTEKETLTFKADGTGELTQPQAGTVSFTYEYRDGAVILMPEGWSPQRYLLQNETLVDDNLDIPKYEKQ